MHIDIVGTKEGRNKPYIWCVLDPIRQNFLTQIRM